MKPLQCRLSLAMAATSQARTTHEHRIAGPIPGECAHGGAAAQECGAQAHISQCARRTRPSLPERQQPAASSLALNSRSGRLPFSTHWPVVTSNAH